MRNILTPVFLFLFFTASAQDGTLDVTYGTSGQQTVDAFPGNNPVYNAMHQIAVLSNGKILQCFSLSNGTNNDFAIVRYTSDGFLDNTFNSGGALPGLAVVDFGANEVATSMAIQADGKVVLAGYKTSGVGTSDGVFALARINTNGTLDATFGTSGKVTTAIGTDANAFSILQSGGVFVVSGFSWSGVSYDFTLVRYNNSGALDATFGTGGKVTTTFGPNSSAYSVIVQSDAKVVAAGFASPDGTTNYFALARYNINGSLDATFGTGGKVTTSIGAAGSDAAYAVSYDRISQKLVAAGSSYNGTDNDFAVVRYNANGTTDATFDGDGKATTAIASGDDIAYTVAFQPDGKILAAGYSNYGFGTDGDFSIVRYLPNGLLDNSFNSMGVKPGTNLIDFAGNDYGYDIATQGNNIIIGGVTGVTLGTARLLNSSVILPASLMSFTAAKQATAVQLNWQTTTEQNTVAYQVLRSTDGNNFTEIGSVQAAGNSISVKDYRFTDAQPVAALNFYRLRVVNANGSTALSKIVAVRFDGQHVFEAFPNPVTNQLNLQLTAPSGTVTVKVIDPSGRTVKAIELHSSGTTLSTSIDMSNLARGVYLVKANEEMIKVVKE
jgi:uncharacterized delta-60 repeat protein